MPPDSTVGGKTWDYPFHLSQTPAYLKNRSGRKETNYGNPKGTIFISRPVYPPYYGQRMITPMAESMLESAAPRTVHSFEMQVELRLK